MHHFELSQLLKSRECCIGLDRLYLGRFRYKNRNQLSPLFWCQPQLLRQLLELLRALTRLRLQLLRRREEQGPAKSHYGNQEMATFHTRYPFRPPKSGDPYSSACSYF